MALVAFTDLQGNAVQVDTQSVYRIEAVPAELLPAGVAAGTRITYLDDESAITVQALPGFVRIDLMAAPGGWPNVELQKLEATPTYVAFNTEALFELSPVPADLVPATLTDGTYVQQTEDGSKVAVIGTVAATAAAWAGGAPATPTGLVFEWATMDAAGSIVLPVAGTPEQGIDVAAVGSGGAGNRTLTLGTARPDSAIVATVQDETGLEFTVNAFFDPLSAPGAVIVVNTFNAAGAPAFAAVSLLLVRWVA